MPVEALRENQCGRVVEIVGPTDWQHRLEELGLREGKSVRLIKQGEPCILAIQDQRLSLRCEPGTMVLVEVSG
ncbi:FeoA family protein [Planctomicrobium sp. SH661]|uniref:FeoA family protein n=1 Tax=Planctomicrobium sp. SH661 TaxID=3448124 RepID=UPI003F5BE934